MAASDPSLCLLCKIKVIIPDTGIMCSGKCQAAFHYECLGLSRNKVKNVKKAHENWKCNNCETEKQPPPSPQSADPVQIKILEKLEDLVKRVMNVENIVLKVESIEKKVNEFEDSIKFISKEYEEIKEKLSKQQEGVAEPNVNMTKMIEENQVLKDEINLLKWKISFKEQQELDDQIVIDGIPEKENENLIQVVFKICNMLKDKEDDQNIISESDIISATRMKSKKYNKTTTTKSAPIHIKLKTKEIKDLILKNKKEFVPMLHTQMVGYEATGKQVYFNPMLTRENKDLLMYARAKLKTIDGPNFKFVWYRNGKVLARKTKDSDVLWCKDKNTVDNI